MNKLPTAPRPLLLSLAALALLSTAACAVVELPGLDPDVPATATAPPERDAGAPPPVPPPAVADEALAAAVAAAQAEAAVEALSEDGLSDAPGPGTAANDTELSASFRCSEDLAQGGATLVRTLHGDQVHVRQDEAGDRLAETVHADDADRLIFTRAGTGDPLRCNGDGTLRVGWKKPDNVDGLRQVANVSGSRSYALRKGDLVLRSRSVTTIGSRQIVWARPSGEPEGKTLAFSRSIVLALNRTIAAPDRQGRMVQMEGSVTTPDSEPLRETAVRNSLTLAWLSRVVSSGALVLRLKDGSRVQTRLVNLSFQPDGRRHCLPVSGSIEGAIYGAGGQAVKTFVVRFGQPSASTVTIAFGDGGGRNFGADLDFPHYQPAGCSF